jgi:hypothetical protein
MPAFCANSRLVVYIGKQRIKLFTAIKYGVRGRMLENTGPNTNPKYHLRRSWTMPKFVIEREIPGAGKLTADQLHAISQKSCSVLQSMGPQIQWLQSYVTDNKIYCVYIAPDEATVREHAKQGGFPANSVAQVRSVIDPTTSE